MLHTMRTTVLAALLAAAAAAPAATIWHEGEDPAKHSMARHPWWYDKVKPGLLSGGAWMSHFTKKGPGTATYRIAIPKAGTYDFWLRANPVKSALSWRIGEGEWQEVDFRGAKPVNVAADDKPDLRFIAWVKLGKLKLDKGTFEVGFRAHSKTENHGAIDVMMLTDEGIVPVGTGRDQPEARRIEVEGTWAFVPPKDTFSDKALLDLRYLNEKRAGQSGFIRRTEDGMGFVRGDGKPIRFWSVVTNGEKLKPDAMKRHVRWLAKLGVNMARIHVTICDTKDGAKLTDVNEKMIDGILRFVAEAKAVGIYTMVGQYWAHVNPPASWGLEGPYQGDTMPWGLLFFDEGMQSAYRTWAKELYARPNPYADGVPLAKDPAVAIVQVQNEDSLLFYTMQGIQEPYAGKLRKLFGAWLTKRYGSLAKARAAWGGARHAKDDFDAGEAGIEIIWRFTAGAPKPAPAQAKRMADQLEFLARLQHGFYAQTMAYLREDLGCKQLLNATNWRSADPVLLDDVERWTYTPGEVSAINRYTGVTHIGPLNGYRVDPGHFYRSESVLKRPETFPGALKQPVGQPMIVTETAWVHPGRYQSEAPLLAAAYLSLTGVDSFYWFCYDQEATWTTNPVWPWWKGAGGLNSLRKWYGAYPQQAGMMPAAALAFRLGYVKSAEEPVVYEERSLEGMWQRRVPIIAEAGKFDPVRDKGDFAPESPIKQEVDRLAFLVGPVHVKFGGSEANSKVADLSKCIDREKGTVRSVTGQIALDYKTGLCTVNAPKLRGVTGFLADAGGTFTLGDVTVAAENDYATVMVVAMDDRPIAESKKVLVQVGTVTRPSGWTVAEAERESEGTTLKGKRIVDPGGPPLRNLDAKVRLTLPGGHLRKAVRLDAAGMAAGDLPLEVDGQSVSLAFPKDALSVVLTAE